jgi:hypothetical protein
MALSIFPATEEPMTPVSSLNCMDLKISGERTQLKSSLLGTPEPKSFFFSIVKAALKVLRPKIRGLSCRTIDVHFLGYASLCGAIASI